MAQAEGNVSGHQSRTCGEVAINLLCDYYGRDFDRSMVLDILKPGTKGESSTAQLRDALIGLGFGCRVVRGTVEDLTQEDSPVIVLAKRDADDPIGHFVTVIWDPSAEQFSVFDPLNSDKPVRASVSGLESHWTGIALLTTWQPSSSPLQRLPIIHLVLAIALGGAVGAVVFLRRKPRQTGLATLLVLTMFSSQASAQSAAKGAVDKSTTNDQVVRSSFLMSAR